MRIFSDFEKKTIKSILRLEVTEKLLNLGIILTNSISTTATLDIDGRNVNDIVPEGENFYHTITLINEDETFSSEYFIMMKKLKEANYLFDYLLDNGYLMKEEGCRYLGIHVNLKDEDFKYQKEHKLVICQKETIKSLMNKFEYYYSSTESLTKLSRNKFRSEEQIGNRNTRIISIISIVVTFLGLVFNYIINQSLKPSQPLQIDKSSIDYFLRQTDSHVGKNDSSHKE